MTFFRFPFWADFEFMSAIFSFLHIFERYFVPSPYLWVYFWKNIFTQNNFSCLDHVPRSCQYLTRFLFFMKQVFSLWFYYFQFSLCMHVIWFMRKLTFSLYQPFTGPGFMGIFFVEMLSDLWVLYLRPNGKTLYEKGLSYPNLPQEVATQCFMGIFLGVFNIFWNKCFQE